MKGQADQPQTFAPALSGQDGVSMISVVIALTVTLVAIGFAAAAYQKHVSARKVVAGGMAARDLGSNITRSLVKTYSTYVAAGCAGPLANISLGRVGSLNQSAFNVPPPTGLPMPKDFKQAMERCVSVPPRQPAGASATKLYGCYKFTANAAAKNGISADSLLNSPVVFVEFTSLLKNFSTAQPTSCQQVVATPSASNGIAGYYALHWVINTTDGPVYKTRYGVAYSDLN